MVICSMERPGISISSGCIPLPTLWIIPASICLLTPFPPQFRSFSPNSHNYPTPLLIPAIFFLPSCHSSLPSFYYALKLWMCLAAHKISRPSSLCVNMSCTLHSYRLKPCFCKYILYYVKIHIDQHAYSTWLQTTGAHICFWSACVHNTCLSRSEHLYSDKCSFPLV